MSARAYPARRVAPRRRPAPRRRGSRVHWDRLGRTALVIVFFLVLASYLRPGLNLFHTWQQSKSGKTEVHKLQLQYTQLKKRADSLKDPNVIRAEARKQGMVLPGERPQSTSPPAPQQ